MQNFISQWNAINFIVMQLIFIAKVEMAQKYQERKNSTEKLSVKKSFVEFFTEFIEMESKSFSTIILNVKLILNALVIIITSVNLNKLTSINSQNVHKVSVGYNFPSSIHRNFHILPTISLKRFIFSNFSTCFHNKQSP